MIQQSDVTILIPHISLNKETDYSLKECLKSLDQTVPDVKKIVSINGKGEGIGKIEDYEYKNVSFIAMERQGQCGAINAAVGITNTPFIFITNNDMIYPLGWYDDLMDDQSVCVSPILIEPRPGAPTFEVLFCGGAGGDFNKEAFYEHVKFRTRSTNPLRTGFNFPVLLRRELWDTIGGYDIKYDPWGSNGDSDLEYKIKLAGVQPMQNQNCAIYHFSQTSGTFEPKNDNYRFKNYAYFEQKWGFPRTDDGIWEANFAIPTKEQGRIFFPEWENKYGRH